MESVCCCPPADVATGATASPCPTCATSGTPIDVLTVKALLTEGALRRLSATNYRFCADPVCAVVYFGTNGHTFTTDDVRVPVWQKQPAGERMICYCFNENESAMRAEIERRGTSDAVERVRQHITADRCACDVRNPRGSCCLGDVIAAVKRLTATLQPIDGKA